MRGRSLSRQVPSRSKRRRVIRTVSLAAVCLASVLLPSWSARGEELDLRPTSSSAARREAVAAIPLEKLNAQDRRALVTVVENASLYRRLPTEVVPCDPRLVSLFMQNPQAMVNLWEVLGISKVRMKPTGRDTFEATDGSGTHGTIRIVESVCDDDAQNRIVVLATGTYQGNALSGAVRADCVALVRSGSVRRRDGTPFVTARVDVFIHLDQVGVELIARTLHPIVVRVADRNFEQTMEFVSSFSEAAAKNPRGVERLAGRLEHVPRDVQDRLTEIAYDLSAHRAAPTAKPHAMHQGRRAASLERAESTE